CLLHVPHGFRELVHGVGGSNVRGEHALLQQLADAAEKGKQRKWILPPDPVGEPEPFHFFAAEDHEARVEVDWLERQAAVNEHMSAGSKAADDPRADFASHSVDGMAYALLFRDFLHAFNQILVGSANNGIAANCPQLIGPFLAANHIDRAKTE